MSDDPADLFSGAMQDGYLGDAAVSVDSVSPAMPVGQVVDETLAGLARNLAIFTHGPMFTHAGLDFPAMDPVREFVEQFDQDPEFDVAIHDFAAPLFRGMALRPEDEVWDRRLLFVEYRFWPALLSWLSAVTPVDRAHGVYHRARPRVLKIVDRAAVERGGITVGVPTVHVTVFEVTGTRHNVRFIPNIARPDGVAWADYLSLDRTILREAGRVLGRHPNPIRCTT